MLISVGARCLNEEELLPIFLKNHQFADEIVVCDGGSTDRSKEIALSDPKVVWVDFPYRVPSMGGHPEITMNPEGKHVNAVIDACRGEWLYITEVDVVPDLAMQDAIRDVIRLAKSPAIGSYLYYVAPMKSPGSPYEYYPALIQGWGLTCWHKDIGLKVPTEVCENLSDPCAWPLKSKTWENNQNNKNVIIMDRPSGRVHLTWCTRERVQNCIKKYALRDNRNIPDPDTYLTRALLPDWIVWNGMY